LALVSQLKDLLDSFTKAQKIVIDDAFMIEIVFPQDAD
jgi:hypothetical protein